MYEKELIRTIQKSLGDSSEENSTGSIEVENEIVDLDEAREHCGNFKIPDRAKESQKTARQPLQPKEMNKKRVETKEMETQSNRTFLSDYYQDVEGNLYHKDQCTAKFIKDNNLIDSMYLYNKYVLNKQPKTEATFTTDEDTTLKNAVEQYGKNFKKIKLRRFKFSKKTKDDLQKRWIILQTKA